MLCVITMGVVGIEVKTDDLEEDLERKTVGKTVEKNIYEKILDTIYNSKVVAEYKYDINIEKRIYTSSLPIPIPYKK